MRRAGFLTAELVAGEGQNLITFVSPALMIFDHLLVVFSGDASLGSYVDYHDQVFVPKSGQIKRISVNVMDFEIKEALTSGDCKFFLAVFHNKFRSKSSHQYKYTRSLDLSLQVTKFYTTLSNHFLEPIK